MSAVKLHSKEKNVKKGQIRPCFYFGKEVENLNCIKKKSINALIDGLSKYEDSKNAVKKSDFTDLKSFVKDYLNTDEPKQRKKLAEEFRKRHMELYQFIKENAELFSAEAEINKIINAAERGETADADVGQINNLLEMIGASANDL